MPRGVPSALLTLFVASTAGAQQASGTALGSRGLLTLPELPVGRFVECTRLVRTFTGEAAGDQFGWVSAPLDDLDGDGVREVVISAPFHGATSAGRIYVVSPRTGKELFRADGGGAGRRLGYSARDAGDVNADGFGDVIAGAPFSRGRVRVYSGNPADGGLLLFQSVRGSSSTTYGTAVAGLGDLDGDGFGDFAVGDSGDDTAGSAAGRFYVLSGGDGGQTVLWSVDGEAAGAQLGSALGRLPDVTGDGKDELIVGAQGAGGGGRAYVYDVVDQVRLHTLVPDPSGVSFGQFFVDSPGDVNANGSADVYVGDFSDTQNGAGAGKAYVFDGASGDLIWNLPGAQAGDGFGIGRGMGDVNGDGHADLLLCGYLHSSGAPTAGQAMVFSGKDLSVLQVVTSRTAGEGLGFDAHGIGDVDGDGELDLFLTAATNGALGAATGRCYVVAGGSPVASIAAGSPGSGGFQPLLGTDDCPKLGRGVAIELSQGLGGAQGVLVLGADQIVARLPGATLVASPDVLVPFTLGGASGVPGQGNALFQVPMGNDPALLGAALVLQAVAFDPAAPGGLAFSDGLRLERVQP